MARIPILTALLLLVVLSVACAPIDQTGELAGASVERTNVYTLQSPAGDVAIVNAQVLSRQVRVLTDNTTLSNRSVIVYGINLSGIATSESIWFNGTVSRASVYNYSSISKIVLNASTVVGSVTVEDNVTREDIAVIPAGNLTAFNAQVLNGSNYLPPLLSFNVSADVDLRFSTEYVVYLACDQVNGSGSVNVSYYVSPDGIKWFRGTTAITHCSNVSVAPAKTTLADAGVAYLRFQVNASDSKQNQVYAKLLYK